MKDKKMSIRISEDDLNIVHRKAKQAKLTLTEYVMEDEFRIRKEIITRVEGTGTEKSGLSKADDELRLRPGEVMDSTDPAATDTDQYAQFDSGITENAGDVERPLGYAGGTADGSRRTDGADTDGVSGDASTAGGADSDDDFDLDGNLPITGWESERELLTATQTAGHSFLPCYTVTIGGDFLEI